MAHPVTSTSLIGSKGKVVLNGDGDILTFLPVTLSMPFAPLPGYPIVWVFTAVIIATPIAMYLLKFIRKPAF